MIRRRTVLVGLLSALALSGADSSLKQSFINPPADARIMMRWWWFGPSVSKPQLEKEMRLMKEGGIGGFEVQPVYPLQLDGNFKFLSPEFLDALKFTGGKARELGLRFDLTLGSGWPFGGPSTPLAQAAGRLRVSQDPGLKEGESLITTVKDQHFIAGHTGQQVKRASFGAEGYVLDHYSRPAIDNYLKAVGDKLMKPVRATPPHAIFCDSLEVYEADWTPTLLEEFRNRRGYDLKPFLPALASDIGPETNGVRHDWGKTLTELLEENFLSPMRAWSKQNKVEFRIQGYGVPPAVISSNSYADISEGEGSQWKVVRAARWASSANHLYGRPITTSETWTWLHSPVFRATPLDIKAEADIHFLQGVNQLIGHGWPYTPEGVEAPGWRFYASGVYNHQNPWWTVMPDLARYLQRVSFLMRQGKPANDVALYMPNSDMWSRMKAGHVHMIEMLREHVGPNLMAQILDHGYGLDFIDDRSLDLPAFNHKIVVLPGVETIPLATMQKLEKFVARGGKVVATRRLPDKTPGLKADARETAEVQAIAKRLLKTAIADSEVGSTLRASLVPDMQLDEVTPEIGFTHRSTPDAEIYFIANTGNMRKQRKAAFRAPSKSAEWWDAVKGTSTPASILASGPQTTTIALDLEPYESRLLVFSAGRIEPVTRERTPQRQLDLSRDWTVRFGDTVKSFDALRSWTDAPDTKHYSGTASYEKTVDLAAKPSLAVIDFGQGTPLSAPYVNPSRASAPGMRAWLDAPVREAAVVYVNDQRAGSVWCPPYRLDIAPFLQPGVNRIRIDVANLALNAMSAKPLPDYRALQAKYGDRFQPQDMNQVKPIPAGLLGPIRLDIY